MDDERVREITARLSVSARRAVQAELRRGMRRASKSPSRIIESRDAARLAPVTLRAEVEINGRTIMAQQPVSQALWKAAQDEPRLFMGLMANVRRALGEAIVRELAPPVTVHLPSELDEAAAQLTTEE